MIFHQVKKKVVWGPFEKEEEEFFGTFLRNKLTHKLTHKLTDGRKGRVTELHVAAKKSL